MNKKIVAGTLLGALSLGVGLNVIPEANYQEGLNVKELSNIKRAINRYKVTTSNCDAVLSSASAWNGKGSVNSMNSYLVTESEVREFSQFIAEKTGVLPLEFSGVIDSTTNLTSLENYKNKKWYLVRFKQNYTYTDFNHEAGTSWDIFRLKGMNKPIINGSTNLVINVNNMLTQEEILSHITAMDDTDGVVPVLVESTTYNSNNKKVGNYTMKVYAQDKLLNKTTLDINIKVVDIDKPTITGPGRMNRSYDEPLTLDEIKRMLVVSDNYDSNLKIEVVSDAYTGHERELGEKILQFKTKDSSNNESGVFNMIINVEDKKVPVLTGPSEVKVSSSSPIALETFKAKFTCSDDYDGALSFNVSGFEQYTADTTVCKTHVITLTGQDKSGNKVSKQVNLIVEDRIAPDIFLDDYFILLNQGVELTPEQIKEYASRALGISVDSIVEVSGEYDTNTPGDYKLAVKLITGETKSVTLSINAVKNYKERTMKWYEYLYKWFTIGFNIEGGYYHTDSFWSIFTRCKNIWELYTTGIYKELIE